MKKILETVADVESAFNELQTVESLIARDSAETNASIAALRDGIVPIISKREEAAKRLRSAIEAWAETNRDDDGLFPKGSKTLELRAGTIAFRTSAPSLILLDGWKTADVIEELNEADTAIKKAGIKIPDPTLDKTALKKLYDQGKIDDKTLKSLGLKIEQSETLSISTKTLEEYAV